MCIHAIAVIVTRNKSVRKCNENKYILASFTDNLVSLNCFKSAETSTMAENNTRVGLAPSMASVGARAYNGGLGAEPPAGVQGAEPPVGGQGQSPLKLMAF